MRWINKAIKENTMKKIISPKPVIGFVRYSLNVKYGNKTQAKNVFEAEYFEYRFNIFCTVTLKSFQQQTDKGFVLLLLHSENMPPEYKDRFMELERTNEFLYNVFVEDNPESYNEAMKQSEEYVSFEKNVAITFRIDNDDAVQNNFIQRLSGFLKNEYAGFVISMPGLCVVKRISTSLYAIEEKNYPSHSIGLANVTNRENYETIMALGYHHRINEKIPMILTPVFAAKQLQTINGENETNSIDDSKIKIIDKKDTDRYLIENRFGNLNLDCLHIIYKINNNSSKSSLEKIVKLLLPPVFGFVLKKTKKFLS